MIAPYLALCQQVIQDRKTYHSRISFGKIWIKRWRTAFMGHDTYTGMAIAFALLLMAENKEAQDLAREEVTRVMDKCYGKLEISDLQDLPYLERCLKESMRLYLPVSTIFRYAKDDLELKHGLVPANTHLLLVIHFFDTHRDPNFWHDQEKFDPDRFLPENTKGRHPFAYIPFSAGPRNCIGQKFAMMELKSTFAHILYDFYLEPVTGLANAKLTADIVIRPNDPVVTWVTTMLQNSLKRLILDSSWSSSLGKTIGP